MVNTFKVGDKEYATEPPKITITATDNATPPAFAYCPYCGRKVRKA